MKSFIAFISFLVFFLLGSYFGLIPHMIPNSPDSVPYFGPWVDPTYVQAMIIELQNTLATMFPHLNYQVDHIFAFPGPNRGTYFCLSASCEPFTGITIHNDLTGMEDIIRCTRNLNFDITPGDRIVSGVYAPGDSSAVYIRTASIYIQYLF